MISAYSIVLCMYAYTVQCNESIAKRCHDTFDDRQYKYAFLWNVTHAHMKWMNGRSVMTNIVQLLNVRIARWRIKRIKFKICKWLSSICVEFNFPHITSREKFLIVKLASPVSHHRFLWTLEMLVIYNEYAYAYIMRIKNCLQNVQRLVYVILAGK